PSSNATGTKDGNKADGAQEELHGQSDKLPILEKDADSRKRPGERRSKVTGQQAMSGQKELSLYLGNKTSKQQHDASDLDSHAAGVEEGAESLQADPNMSRRKRRKTTFPKQVPQSSEPIVSAWPNSSWHEQLTTEASKADNDGSENRDNQPSSDQLEQCAKSRTSRQSSTIPSTPPEATGAERNSPPKKMLRLTASGKFTSPVSNKASEAAVDAPPAKKRKPRARGPAKKGLIAIFKY
ncbi:hypothetical protein LTS18_013505, partial [Coniosporium uncinatum]